jgi:hypothetical protein
MTEVECDAQLDSVADGDGGHPGSSGNPVCGIASPMLTEDRSDLEERVRVCTEQRAINREIREQVETDVHPAVPVEGLGHGHEPNSDPSTDSAADPPEVTLEQLTDEESLGDSRGCKDCCRSLACADMCTRFCESAEGYLRPPDCLCMQSLHQMCATTGIELWTGLVHRVSAVISACALAALANCWLSHRPVSLDLACVGASLLAFALLNSIEYEAITTHDTAMRQKASILIALCYFVFLATVARAIWDPPLDQSMTQGMTCHTSCCRSALGVFAMLLMCSASLLRFGTKGFEALFERSGAQSQPIRPPAWVTVVAAIVAALCLVTGMSNIGLAVYGERGSGAALATLLPLAIGSTCILLVAVQLRAASVPSSVWTAWIGFLPTCTYTFSVLLPMCMQNNHVLTVYQAHRALAGVVSILLGVRIGVAMYVTVARSSCTSGGGTYGRLSLSW